MTKRKNVPKIAHPKDVWIGQRIKAAREAAFPRITQLWLGREIGVTMQQIQKYENGTNRITFSRLYEIAVALDVPLSDLVAEDHPPRQSLSSEAIRSVVA